jgi:hypothetical protein
LDVHRHVGKRHREGRHHRQLFVALGFYSPNAATAHAAFDNVIVNWP